MCFNVMFVQPMSIYLAHTQPTWDISLSHLTGIIGSNHTPRDNKLNYFQKETQFICIVLLFYD